MDAFQPLAVHHQRVEHGIAVLTLLGNEPHTFVAAGEGGIQILAGQASGHGGRERRFPPL